MLAVAGLAQEEPVAPPVGEGGPTLRFVNLLAFTDEARILLDGKVALGNTMSGEISPFEPVAPGAHRLEVVPRHGDGKILTADFSLSPSAKMTLVLTGGPATLATTSNLPGSALPLIAPPSSTARPHPSAEQHQVTCALWLVNTDLRGLLKASLQAGDQSREVELKPMKTIALEDWPVVPLNLRVIPEFKSPSGVAVIADLNLFTPPGPGTFYCILYSKGGESPVRAFYLPATNDGELGQQRDDIR